jgi:hypothetical protein
MRWTEHIFIMGGMKNEYRIYFENSSIEDNIKMHVK